MSYSECLQCQFYVSPHDLRCPNCGLIEPLKEFESEKFVSPDKSAHRFMFLGSAVLLTFVLAMLFGGEVICLSAVALLLFAGMATFLADEKADQAQSVRQLEAVERNKARRQSSPESLAYKQELIGQRLAELRDRQKKIKSVLERAKQNTGEKWNALIETLNSTARVLNTQQARYSLKQSEIELVRWQNSLAPLLYDAEDLSYEQIDARLKQLERARFTGKQWLEEFRAHSLPLGETIEVKHLRERATDLMTSINTLHESYVARQAADTLKGITVFDDTKLADSPSERLLHASDTFNIQVAITDFSAGFDELEFEYARLQSESEISKRLIES